MFTHAKKINRLRITAVLVMVFLGVAIGTIYIAKELGYIPFRHKIPNGELVRQIKPLPGHWLKTQKDKDDNSKKNADLANTALRNKRLAQASDNKDSVIRDDKPVISPDSYEVSASRFMNRTLDNLNILYLWTDNGQLKVLSVMTINHKTKEAALVVIPRFTRLKYAGKPTTLEELYKKLGRDKLAKHLEGYFDFKIPNYLNVDQQAVKDISDLVGPLTLKQEKITILEAFEQTRVGKRTDDQDVVRAVAKKIVNPKILVKLPEIFWIFAHDIKTNLGTKELLSIYEVSRKSNVTQMKKVALPGTDHYVGNHKYRVVSEETWKNIFYDLTQK